MDNLNRIVEKASLRILSEKEDPEFVAKDWFTEEAWKDVSTLCKFVVSMNIGSTPTAIARDILGRRKYPASFLIKDLKDLGNSVKGIIPLLVKDAITDIRNME